MSQTQLTFARFSRRRLIGASLVVGAAALAACAQPPAAPAPTQPAAKPAQPDAKPAAATVQPAAKPAAKRLADSVTYAHTSTAPAFDPHYSLSNSGFMMARQIYDALVTFGEDGKIQPQLAVSWNRIDPLTMEFKLRDNVKYSNGDNFTAATVKWNVERITSSSNPNHSNTKGRMGSLTAAEVVNSTTVRLKTKEPDPILLNRLVSLFMISEKFGAQAGDDGIIRQGIGTGPLKGVRIQQGQSLEFEAWEGSWKGSSKVKQAKWLQFNDDASMVAAFKAGDIDIVFRVEPDQAEDLKNQFNIQTSSAGSATSASILQQHGGAFADRRVRQALNMAVNKQEFVDRLLLGRGDVLDGQLPDKTMFGYNPNLKVIPYDPERAKSLLREAGHPNLALAIGTSVSTRPITEGIAGYLQGVGIDATVQVYEAAVSTRNINTKSPDPLYVFNRDYFHMRDFDIFGPNLALQQEPHFLNEEFKQLYQASRSELNEEKRLQQIQKMSELLHNEYGMLFLFVRQIITPFTKKIAKVPQHFDTATYLWQVEKEA